MNKKIKFGIFADLHVDIMHDPQARLEKFIAACRKEKVDFIIQLGDFCYPDENRKCVSAPDKRPVNVENALNTPTYADKDAILKLFRNFEKPSYHVLGNHDCDLCSKREIWKFYNVDYHFYYSFDMGGFHFVVLDPNYYIIDGNYYSFENGCYFDEVRRAERILPVVPPQQLAWLKEDLAKTTLPTILFSHQGLSESMPGDVLNAKEIKSILKHAPAGVVAAFNGHDHIDTEVCEDGIWFININSMSNQWLGKDYMVQERYTEEIDEKYPNIKYTVPYKDSIFAMITLDENGIAIKGTESEFVGISPKDQGLYEEGSWFTKDYKAFLGKIYITPSIKSRFLPFH